MARRTITVAIKGRPGRRIKCDRSRAVGPTLGRAFCAVARIPTGSVQYDPTRVQLPYARVRRRFPCRSQHSRDAQRSKLKLATKYHYTRSGQAREAASSVRSPPFERFAAYRRATTKSGVVQCKISAEPVSVVGQ